jgi:hypothetical protein
MNLPPIPLETPVIIPASPKQEFDNGFITDLNISASPLSPKASCYIRLVPIDGNGGVSPVGAESYTVDIFAAAAAIPSVAAALGAVITCTPELVAWAKNNPFRP